MKCDCVMHCYCIVLILYMNYLKHYSATTFIVDFQELMIHAGDVGKDYEHCESLLKRLNDSGKV